MSDLIDRQAVIDAALKMFNAWYGRSLKRDDEIRARFSVLPSAQPEIIRCKDCKNQEKFFQKDGRRKNGGYYIYGCSLAEGYSHVCLDDDYCSRAERKEGQDE